MLHGTRDGPNSLKLVTKRLCDVRIFDHDDVFEVVLRMEGPVHGPGDDPEGFVVLGDADDELVVQQRSPSTALSADASDTGECGKSSFGVKFVTCHDEVGMNIGKGTKEGGMTEPSDTSLYAGDGLDVLNKPRKNVTETDRDGIMVNGFVPTRR